MAFAFFRRRQKMVVIVMALLMVSFLIGFQGFQMLTRRTPESRVIGTTSLGDLTRGELIQAENQLDRLERYVGLGNPHRMEQQRWPTDDEFILVVRADRQSSVTYALLLKEAHQSDQLVTEADIDAFFQEIGCPVGSESYRGMIARLKIGRKRGEREIRSVVGNWLRVHKSFVAAAVDVPPSERELRLFYRDLNETIDLLVARVPGENFIDEVPGPTQEEIFEQFSRGRTITPGAYPTAASFGFGYRQPARVRILYLLVRRDVVERVTRPGDAAVREYWSRNRGEFVKEIAPESQPPSAPAGEGATAPATQTAPVRTVQMAFSEAKRQVIEKLTPLAVERRLESVLSRTEALLGEYGKSESAAQNSYAWVKEQMTRPADAALSRQLDVVEIHQERLDAAMAKLGRLSGLQAICYPYGETEEGGLDPAVKVTLSARDITLSEALKQISEQVKWPEVDWAMCEGFDGVIFPVGEKTDLFPIDVRETELMDRNELSADEVLLSSVTPVGQSLALIAFQAETLSGGRGGAIKLNEEAPRMIVWGPRPGRLLWRVTEAVPAHEPETMTPEIQKQVIEDIRTLKAFKLAMQAARKVRDAARKDGLKVAAEREKYEFFTAGPVARKRLFNPRRQLALQVIQGRISIPDAIARMPFERPVSFTSWGVPEIPLPTMQLQEHFLKAAFSLAPKNVEPAPGESPYPERPFAVTVVELPALKEVLILQRRGFRPAVIGEYEETGRRDVLGARMALNGWQTQMTWFGLSDVTRRLRFEPRKE